MTEVSVILHAIESGDARTEDLLPVVYDELRQLAAAQMRRERASHTLQPTALVHEAFLRLVSDAKATWQNRRHFFGAAAIAMQRILVEQARQRRQLQHGGDRMRVGLSGVDVLQSTSADDVDLIGLDTALCEFETTHPEKAELVRLRYFAGLTEAEAAQTLNISRPTASRWWTFSKAWLFARMQGDT